MGGTLAGWRQRLGQHSVVVLGYTPFGQRDVLDERATFEIVMGADAAEPNSPRAQPATWNEPVRIAVHRQLTPGARVQLMIEASRAVLRFARGRRVDDR